MRRKATSACIDPTGGASQHLTGRFHPCLSVSLEMEIMETKFNNVVIEPAPLQQFLSRVSLSDSIDQCLLIVQDKQASVTAVDMTNSVLVIATEDIPLPDCRIGLCNISKIIKLLSSTGEQHTLSMDGSQLTLKSKAFGSARITLIRPEDVPTAVLEEGVSEKIVEQCTTRVSVTRETFQKVSFYSGVFPSAAVMVIGKVGEVFFRSTENEQNQFTVPIGPYKGKDFSTQVYCDFLFKAMANVFTDEKVGKVSLLTGEKKPVIVYRDEGNFWAVTPITG